MNNEIIVGNVGTTLVTNNYILAQAEYHTYVRLSKEGAGRVGGEGVTWMYQGEIHREHTPECNHSGYRTIEHPDGSGGEVPWCPVCDEVVSL